MDLNFWILLALIAGGAIGCLAMAIINIGDRADIDMLEMELEMKKLEGEYENQK